MKTVLNFLFNKKSHVFIVSIFTLLVNLKMCPIIHDHPVFDLIIQNNIFFITKKNKNNSTIPLGSCDKRVTMDLISDFILN